MKTKKNTEISTDEQLQQLPIQELKKIVKSSHFEKMIRTENTSNDNIVENLDDKENSN